MGERLWAVAAWIPALGLSVLLAVHLAAIGSGGMLRVVAWLFLTQLVPLVGLASLGTVVLVLAVRRTVGIAGRVAAGVAVLAVLPAISGWGLVPVRYPSTLEDSHPTATVRLPTDSPMVVLWGGDALAANYHGIDAAQRWAYDLLIEPALVQSDSLEDYGCYGVPVLAPADGRVTQVVDGIPDQIPSQYTPNYTQPAGNMVAIRLSETQTHLVLAHLQPGSVAVATGDEVHEGQVLGLCGSSGNSSEPHVHLHHQRQDPAVIGLLAEGLPLYFRDHDGQAMPTGGFELDGETATLTGDRIRHAPRNLAR